MTEGVQPTMLIAGVDEAGRGPLAGPVYAAAVILDPERPIPGLGDSKTIAPARRDALELAIKSRALAWGLAFASAEEIDRLNVLQASLLAMRRAVAALDPRPVRVLVDGNRLTDFGCEAQSIVGGDGLVPAIGAASILAKVARDRRMCELDLLFPGYGFAGHKGYPTAAHREALRRLGPCPEHRRSFGPVRELLSSSSSEQRCDSLIRPDSQPCQRPETPRRQCLDPLGERKAMPPRMDRIETLQHHEILESVSRISWSAIQSRPRNRRRL